jgi:hypothetical protein
VSKAKLALTVVSILIIALPFAFFLITYQNNLLDTVLTPEIKDALGNGIINQNKLIPKPIGGTYNPQTSSISFQFNFTNPLPTKLSINKITTDIVALDDNVLIAHLSLKEPVFILPYQNVVMQVSGPLESGVAAYFVNYVISGHSSVHVVLSDLNVEAGGVSVHTDQTDAGSIPLGGAVIG